MKIQGKKGFTLIELIVIISIMSLLLTISLPKLDRGTYRLLEASKALRDDIRYVRYMVMTEGQNLKIIFNRDYYQIVESSMLVKQIRFPKDFSLYQNFVKSQVAFSYYGAPSTGGTITLVNDKNKRYCEITVVPGTGRILLKNEVYSDYKGL